MGLMGEIQGQLTTMQNQVENLVEHSAEASAVDRTTQVTLHQADSHLQDLSTYLVGVPSGYLVARASKNSIQGG